MFESFDMESLTLKFGNYIFTRGLSSEWAVIGRIEAPHYYLPTQFLVATYAHFTIFGTAQKLLLVRIHPNKYYLA